LQAQRTDFNILRIMANQMQSESSKQGFEKKFQPAYMKKFQVKNVNQVPRLEKLVVNVGAGEAVQNSKVLDFIQQDLKLITGQKPVLAKAKKSIATFKLREGLPIGVFVTLRGVRMYNFIERLVNIALPRIRDFKGVSPKAFDSQGNYTLGIREQLVFTEIDFDKTDKVRGLSITFVTSAENPQQARFLLENLGIPFREN